MDVNHMVSALVRTLVGYLLGQTDEELKFIYLEKAQEKLLGYAKQMSEEDLREVLTCLANLKQKVTGSIQSLSLLSGCEEDEKETKESKFIDCVLSDFQGEICDQIRILSVVLEAVSVAETVLGKFVSSTNNLGTKTKEIKLIP